MRQEPLYTDFIQTISALVSERATVLDIGAGDGAVARLMADRSPRIALEIVGVEPRSSAHEAGLELAARLVGQDSLVRYAPHLGRFQDWSPDSLLGDRSLRGLVFMKSAHEVCKTLESKPAFFAALGPWLKRIEPGGFLAVADPSYLASIVNRPDSHQAIVDAACAVLDQQIHHHHSVGEYLTPTELISGLAGLGWDLRSFKAHIDVDLLRGLRATPGGAGVEISPCDTYVAVFSPPGRWPTLG